MGYRTWNTGDTVSATDFTSYIANQCVFVFTTATARDAAITSPSEGMFAFTTTTPADGLAFYDGAAWVDTSLTADITDVLTAANSSLQGGGSSGSISISADVNNTTSATATASDYVLIEDVDDSSATKKALISDITAAAPQGTVTSVTGTSPIASSGGATPAISVTTTDAQFILSAQVFSG